MIRWLQSIPLRLSAMPRLRPTESVLPLLCDAPIWPSLPILPAFRRGALGARSLGRRLHLGRAPGAIVRQQRATLGHLLGAGFLRTHADRPHVAPLRATHLRAQPTPL